MRHIKPLFLAGVLLANSACTARYLHSVNDGPGQVTLMETTDVKGFGPIGITKHVFWECTSTSDTQLDCTKVCDIRDDTGEKLVCPVIAPGQPTYGY